MFFFQVNSDHRMKMLMDRYVESTTALKELYEDRDGARKTETTALSGPNELNEFYSRLKQLKGTKKKFFILYFYIIILRTDRKRFCNLLKYF